jgi:Ca2+-binding EF-hand superfamily protein
MAFTKFGKRISDEELGDIMASHDVSGEGSINVEDFKQMMLDFEDIVDDI